MHNFWKILWQLSIYIFGNCSDLVCIMGDDGLRDSDTSCDRDGPWAPSQYPKRRLSVSSHKVSKPRDRYFRLSYRFEIWEAHRQHCCRSTCQISERSDNSKYKSRGFETLRDLTERRLFGYWDGALGVPGHLMKFKSDLLGDLLYYYCYANIHL